MTAIPTPEHTTARDIMAWWEKNADNGHRPHLGASLIGTECERALWFTFRWVLAQAWGGRMLRLFDDGKRAEPRFVAELRGIGCTVFEHDEAGNQFRVSAIGGHFGGSLDAVVSNGLAEAPKTPHVAEFKTSNDKAFKALVKAGVRKSKPLHYAQMQVYMGLEDLERAVYICENKNDAELYVERVHFDPDEFARLLAKAERIIKSSEPPPKIAGPDDMPCKWCNFVDVCHADTAPEVNCRTCAFATPKVDGTDGTWVCERSSKAIPIALQRLACDGHRYIPALLHNIGTPIDSDGDSVQYRIGDGSVFINGPAPAFSSWEIRASAHKTMLGDEDVQKLKKEFSTCKLVG